jgi:cytochrome d ubiquinol oxidase subunit I
MLRRQPTKFAAIETRCKPQQPTSEVLLAVPDDAGQRILVAIEIPKLGGFI